MSSEHERLSEGKKKRSGVNKLMDRHPCKIDAKTLEVWVRSSKQMRGKNCFGCLLCGHLFEVGDIARWIYANYSASPFHHGNFFVCDACDGEDIECLQRAAELVTNINPVLKARL